MSSLQSEALRVLLSCRLQDKLHFCARAPDQPGKVLRHGPPSPGRPPELRWESGAVRAPVSEHELEDPKLRGRALHDFANHELLAVEVMALMILRFPDAPAAFRRGLAQTLREEQTHLRLYLERMKELGTEFGDHPVSGFFWKVFAPVDRPEAYAAGMALTFEQANLDYSFHFARQFRRFGDARSAEILDRIRADEIRHVKFGKVWLDRWTDRQRPLFERYQAALPAPLTPRRARGLSFDRAGREAAGLDASFIDRVRSAQHSKGRRSTVWRFNPEWDLQTQNTGPLPPVVQDIAHDLAPLMAFAVPKDDLVLAPPPPAELRTALHRAGLTPCEAVTDVPDGHPVQWWAEAPRALGSKATGHRLTPELRAAFSDDSLVRPEDFGEVVRDVKVLEDRLRRRRLGSPWRLKPLFGSSGRGQTTSTCWESIHAYVRKAVQRDGGAVLEPELPPVLILSIQIDGRMKRPYRGSLGLLCTKGGTFRGHVLTDPLLLLRPDHRRRVGGGRGLVARLQTVARVAADALARSGYVGPAGVDAMLYRSEADGALCFRPVLEVNPRLTFGHVAAAMRGRAAPGSTAVHWVVPKERVPELRDEGIELDARGRWVQGSLPTIDPWSRRRFGSYLEVRAEPWTPSA